MMMCRCSMGAACRFFLSYGETSDSDGAEPPHDNSRSRDRQGIANEAHGSACAEGNGCTDQKKGPIRAWWQTTQRCEVRFKCPSFLWVSTSESRHPTTQSASKPSTADVLRSIPVREPGRRVATIRSQGFRSVSWRRPCPHTAPHKDRRSLFAAGSDKFLLGPMHDSPKAGGCTQLLGIRTVSYTHLTLPTICSV